MTGDKISGVLYAHAAFNARFDEVSKYAENGNNGTAQHCKRQVQGIELRLSLIHISQSVRLRSEINQLSSI